MPPRELFYALVALAIGHAVAVTMAMWRRPKPQEEVEEVGDEVIYGSRYEANVLPVQEERHPELVAQIRSVAQSIAADGSEITTDDIHPHITLPPGVDPRIFGVAFVPRKLWLKTGRYKPTIRKEANSRPLACWQLRSAIREAAQ